MLGDKILLYLFISMSTLVHFDHLQDFEPITLISRSSNQMEDLDEILFLAPQIPIFFYSANHICAYDLCAMKFSKRSHMKSGFCQLFIELFA